MALTTQDIHASADALAEQGIKPTLAEVRKALGGGSFTTISEAMKSWRQDNQEEEQLKQVELPNGITERLQSLGADMWQTAINIANERLTAEREALAIAQTKAQAETDEAQEAVKMLESEQVELLEQLDFQQAQAEQATTDAVVSRTALETATAQHRTDIDAIKQQLSDTQHKLELEQERSSAAQQTVNELRSKLDEVGAQLMQARESVATANAQSKNQTAEIERLKSELSDSKALNTQKDAKIKQLTDERNEIITATAEIRGELRATTAERDKLTQSYASLNAEYKALNKQYHELSANYHAERESK